MSATDELLTRMCKCLAFHAVETELTFQFMTPKDPGMAARSEEAKALVAEAGLDLYALYPGADRPTAVLDAHVDGMLSAGC
jgi:hypothetical protein